MTASPDDRTDQVDETETAPETKAQREPAKKTAAKKPAPKVPAAKKPTPVKRPTAKSTTAKSTPARSTTPKSTSTKAGSLRAAADQAATTPEVVIEPLTKAVAARSSATKSTAETDKAAVVAAATKSSARKPATAKKTAASKTTATKAAAAKSTASKTAASKATASTAAAAKTATAKTAAEKTAAAKSTARAASAKTTSTKTAAAAKAAATKAAAARAAKEEAERKALEEQATASEEVADSEVAAPDVAITDEVAGDTDQAEEVEASAEQAEPVPEVLIGVEAATGSEALTIRGLVKQFGDNRAVDGINLTVPAGSFYGVVGPNGAGKTTTLSIVAGLLRADEGSVVICGVDQAARPQAAKRLMGVLPDRLRTFDRLTGRQLLYYYGLLRGLAADVIEKRAADLARAFDLGDALSRVVSDYSAGMTKKIMLAGAMIHSPRVLVLDEPFESVDPVSSAVILDILRAYVSHGGTVILSSHGMDLVERVCSRVAIIVGGEVLAEGTIEEVRAGQTLEARFVELAGSTGEVEGLEWLHTFSD